MCSRQFPDPPPEPSLLLVTSVAFPHNRVMRVLFIEVDTESSWAVAGIGPAFIASYLRREGYDVGFLRATVQLEFDAIAEAVRQAAPDIIGMSLTTRQWLPGRALACQLRERFDVPIIAGGLHPTFAPEAVLASPGFDYVCLGEGEVAMVELLRALQSGKAVDNIPNIWVKGGSRPVLRPPYEPIDDLPFLARDLLDEPRGVVHMATQRGCPFPCTYCAARMFNELYQDTGQYGRRRSHANVLEELAGLRDAGRLSYVIFLDDTFTIYRRWVKEFCRVYGQEFAVPFSLHARVETVTEEMLNQLATAGCQQITYGVESGSETIRREVMQRGVTNQRFHQVFEWTRNAGIQVTANYMLGLPGETRDDLQLTLDLATELDTTDFGYFVFYPYPGTRLFRECLDKGYLPADHMERPANHRETILDLPYLRKEDIGEYYDRFTELRRQRYERWVQHLPEQSRAEALKHVQEFAATG